MRAEQLEQFAARDRCQTQRRLVEQQQPGLGHQSARDRQHLLLSARQGARCLSAPLAQSRKQVVHLIAPATPPVARFRRDCAEVQVVFDREVGKHEPAFRHQHEARFHAPMRWPFRDVFALE